MGKHRYKLSFFLTALLYGLLFFLYLYSFRTLFSVSDVPPKEKAIMMALSRFVPQVEPHAVDVPLQPEETMKEEATPQDDPTPVEEPVVHEEPINHQPLETSKKVVKKPKPIVKPPMSKPSSKPKKVYQKSQKKYRKKAPKHAKHRVAKKRSAGGSPCYSAAQRNRFLGMIRKRIERAKSYPRIARRRGMQGTVSVRFTILSNGHVANITLTGPKVFHASARKAVRSAFPVDVKQTKMRFPAVVNLSLRYTLR